MTAATLSRAATRTQGHYGLRNVVAMEWLKLKSLRSTWLTLLIFTAAMIALGALVLANNSSHWATSHNHADFDPTNSGFTGLALGQFATGILGILIITGEYASGMIRATFGTAPRRPLVLAGKAAVLAAVTLVIGEIVAFVTFFVGQAMLHAPAPHAALGQPGVLRAVLMAGAYPALIALIGLGLGVIIRHTAGAISALVGVLFVLPLVLLPLPQSTQDSIDKFLPMPMMENSLTAVKPVTNTLSPGIGLALLCLYAAVALVAGGWVLTRRDA